MRMYWQLNHLPVRDTIPSLGSYAFASLILESSSRRGYCTLQHLETSVRTRPWSTCLDKDQISHLKECSDRLTTFNDLICVLGTHIA